MPQSIQQILAKQLEEAHQGFLGTLEGLTNEQANFQPAGTALAIGAIWVHCVESEDMFVSAITGQPTLESNPDWQGKTGFSEAQPMDNWQENYPKWAHSVQIDVGPLTKFSQAIFAHSQDIVSHLDAAELEHTRDMGPMGAPTVEHIISAYLTGHCNQITGEISAIKGIQGLKGYPW